MLLIECPFCGKRPEIEFTNGGETPIIRPTDPDALIDEEWADFLFYRTNPKGLHGELWHHIHGCAKFFKVTRDTRTEQILATSDLRSAPEERR